MKAKYIFKKLWKKLTCIVGWIWRCFLFIININEKILLIKIFVSLVLGFFLVMREVFGIDLSTLGFILIVFSANGLLNIISIFYKLNTEENNKLVQNYHSLIDKYRGDLDDMLEYTNINNNIGSKYVDRKTKSIEVIRDNLRVKNTYRFPIIYDNSQINSKFSFTYEKGNYNLPEDIKERKSEILNAHHASHVYNRTTQRIKNVEKKDDMFLVSLEKTSYYEMLVSNRAIDYYMDGFGTIRDRYEEGPSISSLSDSKLANHFGYAIIVKTKDNKYIFSKRKAHASIGKNTLGTGVSSVLKVDLEKESYSDAELKVIFNKSINKEIQNELGIANDGVNYSFDFDKNNLGIYRDLTEGGKPQFLFYIKLNINASKFISTSKKYFKQKKELNCKGFFSSDKKLYKVNFAVYSEDELKNSFITPDFISIGTDVHKAIPLFSSAIAIYLQNMDKINNKN